MEHVKSDYMLRRLATLENTGKVFGLSQDGIREYNFLCAFKNWLDNVDYQVQQFERMYEASYGAVTCEGSVK